MRKYDIHGTGAMGALEPSILKNRLLQHQQCLDIQVMHNGENDPHKRQSQL